jgi:threonine/homoserine/homoserine lactone efflux protein
MLPPKAYEQTLANMVAARPDFLVDLGDTFMTDKRGQDYRRAIDQYDAQRYYFGLHGYRSQRLDGRTLAEGLVAFAVAGSRQLVDRVANASLQRYVLLLLLATLGVIAGDQILIWAAVAGMAALLLANPVLFGLLQWAGATYLVWLGTRLIWFAGSSGNTLNIPAGRYFSQSMLITMLNPKAIVFYLAFFPLFIDPQHHRGLLTFAAMALIAAALTFLYGLILCSVATRLADHFKQHRSLAVWLNRLAGVVMMVEQVVTVGLAFVLLLRAAQRRRREPLAVVDGQPT